MVLVEAITPRGGTSTRGKNPPQGGQHTGHAPTTGGHTTPRGARRGAPHRGGHQHTRESLPPANRGATLNLRSRVNNYVSPPLHAADPQRTTDDNYPNNFPAPDINWRAGHRSPRSWYSEGQTAANRRHRHHHAD